MKRSPDKFRLGRPFSLPPGWRRLLWPVMLVSGSGTALSLWFQEEMNLIAECAPIAALPGLAGLLYWLNNRVFKAAILRDGDLSGPAGEQQGLPGRLKPSQVAPAAWHTLSVEETFDLLESTPAGLLDTEAARRQSEFGPNELKAAHTISWPEILLGQFKNVLIIILLVGVGLSAILGHSVEAIAILVIVLFAVLLGFAQEYRAERAIEVLRQMAGPTATVLRSGTERNVAASELVPGDVILLKTGDKIPADSRLMDSINLQTDEAALTGESLPVTKITQPLANQRLPVGDQQNMVFTGTAITYGRGRAVVVATGMNTEFGKVAQLLQSVETSRTPLQKNLDRVGQALARAALVIVAVIIVLGLLRGQPVIELFIFGIALAVAVVPEALPAVVTISLAIGVQRMANRNALVRRLPAVETLGSTSVICSDKTGTLTKDEMTVREIYTAGEIFEVSGVGYEPNGIFSRNGETTEPPETLARLLLGAVLASDAQIVRHEPDGRWEIKGDPTEGALVVAAAKAGLDKAELDTRFPRVNEIPFTSETKRMTTLHTIPEGVVAYSKGAPEIILDSCARHYTGSRADLHASDNGRSEQAVTEADLDAADRERILEAARRMAASALRVLAVAVKPGATLENAEQGMTFLGLVGMIDPPRPEAREAIQTCEYAGIRAVMITGDHPLTGQAVARELGLLKSGQVLSGAELDSLSEEDFERDVEKVEVFARVSPAHKLRVVTALQKKGHIVAMTGDGVNDAPALKKADIGIAMGITGTDVTKEAAAMMLTDDNFASIVTAVEEGRGIYGNIKKYLMYLLSSNIGEIGLMVGATLLGLPLPLSAVQILYVNLFTDGLPALALAVDPPESDLMRRAPRNPRMSIFTRPVVTLMMVAGLWSTLVNLGLYIWARGSGRSDAEAMTMTFVCLVLIQFFNAYNFRSDRHSALRRPFANRWLNLAILWEIILLGLTVYLPFLQTPFGTFGLSLIDWLIVLGLAFTVMPVLELAKWMQRKGWFGQIL